MPNIIFLYCGFTKLLTNCPSTAQYLWILSPRYRYYTIFIDKKDNKVLLSLYLLPVQGLTYCPDASQFLANTYLKSIFEYLENNWGYRDSKVFRECYSVVLYCIYDRFDILLNF